MPTKGKPVTIGGPDASAVFPLAVIVLVILILGLLS